MGVWAVAPAVQAASAASTWRVNTSPEVSTALMDTMAPGRYDLQSFTTGAAGSDARYQMKRWSVGTRLRGIVVHTHGERGHRWLASQRAAATREPVGCSRRTA